MLVEILGQASPGAERLHAEPDSAQWLHRLQLYGLDLRNIPAVEAFAEHLTATEPSLEIIIHNAADMSILLMMPCAMRLRTITA